MLCHLCGYLSSRKLKHKQEFAKDKDGNDIRVECTTFEFSCEGYNPIPVWLGGSNGTKKQRLFHNVMPLDEDIQQQIVDKINSLLASYQPPTSASNPAPITDISFDARFRAINDWAMRNGYASAFSNFHQADHGQGLVYGGVLLKPDTAEVRAVRVADLGNPSTDEERFRAVNDWAMRNGYASGFPNFHQADDGSGVVFGVVLLKPGTAEIRDVRVADLGNPSTNEERFRAVNDWAMRNGYASGFPNFHQGDDGSGVVFGVVLLKPGTAEIRDVPVSELR